MIDHKDIGLIVALLAKQSNEILALKAICSTILKQQSEQQGKDWQEVKKETDAIFAKSSLEFDSFHSQLIKSLFQEEGLQEDTMTVEGFLKKYFDKN